MWGVPRTHWLAQLSPVQEEGDAKSLLTPRADAENGLTPVDPHDGDGVDRLYPACGRVVWVPSWRGDTFWACTRVLSQLKVVLFFVSWDS